MTSLKSPITPLLGNEVFAVGDTSVQLVIRDVDPRADSVSASVDGKRSQIALRDGVGIGELSGLAPDAEFAIELLNDRGDVIEELTGRTLSLIHISEPTRPY